MGTQVITVGSPPGCASPCCCCECTVTVRVHKTPCTGTAGPIDLDVSDLDCEDEPSGGVHTFAAFTGSYSEVQFCYSREDGGIPRRILYTIENELACTVGGALYFSHWLISGYPGNADEFETNDSPYTDEPWCWYGQSLPIELAGSGPCNVVIDAYFYDKTLTFNCECASCYIDGEKTGQYCDCEIDDAPSTPCRTDPEEC